MLPSVGELINDADDSMFSKVLHNVNHVLHQLMPPPQRNTGYNLRSRHHDRSLTQKTNGIVESDYIICMLFKDSY